MTAEYPTLAQLLSKYCCCGFAGNFDEWGTKVQDQWLKTRTITRVEQLDALPQFSVVRDRVGTVWEREDYGSPSTPWWQTGDARNSSPAQIRLPALLLWHPGVDP